MIIDIEEGLLDLQQSLVNTLGVDPDIFEREGGKVMAMEIALIYIRYIYLEFVNRGTQSDAAIMAEIASALFKAGQAEAQVKAKTLSDLVMRYEHTNDNSDLDDKPEGEAYFHVTEFTEEAFSGIEEIVMDIFRREGPNLIYKLSLPTGAAGHKMIKAELIINDASTVRVACGQRSIYNQMIRSIVLE